MFIEYDIRRRASELRLNRSGELRSIPCTRMARGEPRARPANYGQSGPAARSLRLIQIAASRTKGRSRVYAHRGRGESDRSLPMQR